VKVGAARAGTGRWVSEREPAARVARGGRCDEVRLWRIRDGCL